MSPGPPTRAPSTTTTGRAFSTSARTLGAFSLKDGATRSAAVASSTPYATPSATRFSPSTRRARRGPAWRRKRGGTHERAVSRRRRPARRLAPSFLHLRRRDLPRLGGGHARIRASRQWRSPRRPLLQVSPAARNSDRRRGGAERARRRLARAGPLHAQSARHADRTERRAGPHEPGTPAC